MSSEKEILQKDSHGDHQFTPYGEFLSYYHAHLQIFTGIIKRKNLPPDQTEKNINQLKSFMKQNITKVDHFFENMKAFAEMIGYTEETLNVFLHKNFVPTLNKVQEQLKKQESNKTIIQPTASNYDLISEEIAKELGFFLGAGLSFKAMENRVVLENSKDGTVIEPVSSMAIAENQADVKLETKKEAVAPVHYGKEKLILDEIIQGFGEILKGQKLEIIEDIKEDIDLQEENLSDPDILPIEDLDFENPTEEEPQHDISDILGLVEDAPPPPPEEDEADLFTYADFTHIINAINGFTAKKDLAGYNQWLTALSPVEKSFISIRNFLTKEAKGEMNDWPSIFSTVEKKAGLKVKILEKLKTKIIDFQKFKSTLEGTAKQLGAKPEITQLVKMAWPHIQKAVINYPDKEHIRKELDILFNKIQNQQQRNLLKNAFLEILK